MTFLAALLTTCLLWNACWLPARLAVARWLGPFAPLERLCLSVMAGAFGVYSAWMLGLVARCGPGGCLALAVASWTVLLLASLAWSGRSGRSILPEGDEVLWALRIMLIPSWMLLFAWTQSTLYGGGWSGDWNEHYRRTLLFLGRIPAGQPLEFGVTDRPPLFNILAAAATALAGTRFSDYQMVALILSATAAIPCLLLLSRLTGRTFAQPRELALFALLFALHPTIAANTLYTWTRMLAAFFVIAAVYFYLLFLDGREEALPWSFLAAGLSVVTHYSSLVPVALVAGHWLWGRRPACLPRTRSLALGAALTPPALWAYWALREFGWRATLSSNTTAHNYAKAGVGVLRQWGYNLLTTVVPFWDWAAARPYFRQAHVAGAWSDALHLYWVSTLVGSVSTSLAIACLVVWLRRKRPGLAPAFRRREARALLTACLAAFALTFPTIPNAEVAGFAHLALQPVVIVVCVVGFAWIVSQGLAARRLFVALYGAEGLLLYGLKSFDRTAIPESQLGFGYVVNKHIQESHHLTLLFDRDPGFAIVARSTLLAGVVLLWVGCVLWPPADAKGPPGQAAARRPTPTAT